MSWAARRRFLYLLGLAIIVGALTLIPTYIHFKQPPTCFDGKQNQGETQVDKGGPCSVLDENALIPLAVQWARAFPTQEGLYNAVAYIENANEGAGVRELRYEMKLYDSRNVLVAVRAGKTFIMPGSVNPIFEARIEAGNRVVTRAFLDVTPQPQWERAEDRARMMVIENVRPSSETTAPRIDATVHSVRAVSTTDVKVVAVAFDTAGNAFAGSRTALDIMQPDERKEVSFTWPQPWIFTVGRIDVLPVVEPEWTR
ncbi:hypothetical protein EBR66_00310 [bacterium]|nr:hypothetical protein [bacterium]